ncbi:MAG: hypothetical protein ACXWPM_11025 [Bdellovibrionota bacterium]
MPLPNGTETLSAKILGGSGENFDATMIIKRWSDQERKSRARKRTFRILGTIFACSLIGLFVHILLLVIIPGLFITMIAAFPLFLRLRGEEITFFRVDGPCPYCHEPRALRPYLDTQYREEVTVQCPECGQTARAVAVAG